MVTGKVKPRLSRLKGLVVHQGALHHADGDGVETRAVLVKVGRVAGEDLLVAGDIGGQGVSAAVPHLLVAHVGHHVRLVAAVDVDPGHVVAQLEGPGLAAVLSAPLLGGAGLELAAVVELQQIHDEAADDVVLGGAFCMGGGGLIAGGRGLAGRTGIGIGGCRRRWGECRCFLRTLPGTGA